MLIPGIDKIPDNNIIQVVEDYYKINGTTVKDKAGKTIYIRGIKTKRRFRPLVVARQVCMYLMRKHTKKTYHEIADEFDMDHASVMAAEKQINNLLFRDKKLQREIEEIENILKLNN